MSIERMCAARTRLRRASRVLHPRAAVASVLMLCTTIANAGYYGPVSLLALRNHPNNAWLRVSGAPASVCTNWSDQFAFDPGSAFGKQLLATLLLAQVANKQVRIWYDDSTAIGSTETNGCNFASAAKVTGIRLSD